MSTSSGKPEHGTPSPSTAPAARTSPAVLPRRRFLLGLGAGAAGAAVATAAAVPAVQAAAVEADTTPASKGYQETEHVRNYYRSARI